MQYLYFKPRMSRSKHESSGDVAGTVLYFSRACTVRLKYFLLYVFGFFFFLYYLCEKYYKPITVQCYIADCGSWVPRLSLLDL